LTEHGHTATAAPGKPSQFDVFAGDTLIFSKQRDSRFPEPAEILKVLTSS
jgi:predicted Rdx family selenoprotein